MRYAFLIPALLFSVLLTAQSLDATTATDLLREGGLLIRLPSQRTKITTLIRLLENPELKARERERLTAELESTTRRAREENLSLVQAFRENYDAGPIWFMYDADSEKLLDGRRSGFLLQDDLTLAPDRELPEQFLLARFGYANAADESGAEALVLTGPANEPIDGQFPDKIAIPNLGFLVNLFLAGDIAWRKRAEKLSQRVDRKLGKALEN